MAHELPDGFLIVFEGIDGVGKTTQLQMASEALQADNWPTISRRNLGGTPIGEELRQVMFQLIPRPAETDLYICAAIQAALIEQVRADRKQGKVILLDRGPLSLAAYEIFGSGLDEALGWQYVEEGMAKLKPDLTIIYQADMATALQRAKKQSSKADYFESKPLDYFERVAKGYVAAAERYKNNIVTQDANHPPEAVHRQTMAAIRQVLPA